MEAHAEEPTRLRLVTDIDPPQRGKMLGVIREEAQLQFALQTMDAYQHPNGQPDLIRWRGRIGSFAIHKTRPTRRTEHSLCAGFSSTTSGPSCGGRLALPFGVRGGRTGGTA